MNDIVFEGTEASLKFKRISQLVLKKMLTVDTNIAIER